MNNKQPNCFIISMSHNTISWKSWRLYTHTHTHINSINAFQSIHKTTHIHPSTLAKCGSVPLHISFSAWMQAPFANVHCCWFHNNAVLSSITPKALLLFLGRRDVSLCFLFLNLPGPELRLSVCQRVPTPAAALSPSLLIPIFYSPALSDIPLSQILHEPTIPLNAYNKTHIM